MKILITGVSGLVGSALAIELLNRGHKVTGTGRSSAQPAYLPDTIEYISLDLSVQKDVQELLKQTKVDAIVHAAAMSKPNDCELQPELCNGVNTTATKHLLKAMDPACYFLFLSTDFVFGHDGPYSEADDYSPVNVYGRSKMEAELEVKRIANQYGIVRTVLVYGRPLNPEQATFPQWVRNQLAVKEHISVFTDQQRTATYLSDLVGALCTMLERKQQGTYHICGGEEWTPYAMAVRTAEHLQLDVARIKPISRDDMKEPAMRPLRSTLSIGKAKKELGFTPTSFTEVLHSLF